MSQATSGPPRQIGPPISLNCYQYMEEYIRWHVKRWPEENSAGRNELTSCSNHFHSVTASKRNVKCWQTGLQVLNIWMCVVHLISQPFYHEERPKQKEQNVSTSTDKEPGLLIVEPDLNGTATTNFPVDPAFVLCFHPPSGPSTSRLPIHSEGMNYLFVVNSLVVNSWIPPSIHPWLNYMYFFPEL